MASPDPGLVSHQDLNNDPRSTTESISDLKFRIASRSGRSGGSIDPANTKEKGAMRLFFNLALALLATAGTTGCQTAICTSCSTAMPQTIAKTGCTDCAAPTCDSKAGCDGKAPCTCDSMAGCDGGVGCGCGSAACSSGSAGLGVPAITPVRNLTNRLRARAESNAVCADGSCGTSQCVDGSCGSGQQSTSLFGGLFRRPVAGAGSYGTGSYGTGGYGAGAYGAGGMGLGAGGIAGAGMGHGHGIGGCGVAGCGVGGRFCGRCGAGNEHPYGGMSPHTPPMAGPFGPMSPAYGYPYYTTRGPRDFFLDNPPSLGR